MAKEQEDEIRAPILEVANAEGGAYHSTANLWDDGILDPARTRDALGLALAVAASAPSEGRQVGYGTFRM